MCSSERSENKSINEIIKNRHTFTEILRLFHKALLKVRWNWYMYGKHAYLIEIFKTNC